MHVNRPANPGVLRQLPIGRLEFLLTRAPRSRSTGGHRSSVRGADYCLYGNHLVAQRHAACRFASSACSRSRPCLFVPAQSERSTLPIRTQHTHRGWDRAQPPEFSSALPDRRREDSRAPPLAARPALQLRLETPPIDLPADDFPRTNASANDLSSKAPRVRGNYCRNTSSGIRDQLRHLRAATATQKKARAAHRIRFSKRHPSRL